MQQPSADDDVANFCAPHDWPRAGRQIAAWGVPSAPRWECSTVRRCAGRLDVADDDRAHSLGDGLGRVVRPESEHGPTLGP